jgi:GMP synthase (glutamine-hydrolysing)
VNRSVKKPLLIIKTGTTIEQLLATGDDFEQWFASGMEIDIGSCIVRSLHLGESLPPLESIGGIVITGSPAYVTDLADWNYIGADYIRRAHKSDIPILGVCYGHQLIAWAFGGRVDFNPKGRVIGTVTVETTKKASEDALFKGLPQQFLANASHLQSVIELPPDAVRLAYNSFDANHGFSLGETTWGIQFHPEFSAEATRAYINARSSAINSEGLDASALLREVEATPVAKSLLTRFNMIMASNSS